MCVFFFCFLPLESTSYRDSTAYPKNAKIYQNKTTWKFRTLSSDCSWRENGWAALLIQELYIKGLETVYRGSAQDCCDRRLMTAKTERHFEIFMGWKVQKTRHDKFATQFLSNAVA